MGIKSLLRGLVVPKEAPAASLKLSFEEMPSAVYVIGDVHGCHRLQVEMEEKIVADGQDIPGEKLILYVGDLVDRGDQSAQVIDACLAPSPPGFQRICLLGNHELMFRDFLDAPSRTHPWLDFGGKATLRSYGLDENAFRDRKHLGAHLAMCIPESHIAFLHSLPLSVTFPDYFIAHAGIDPAKSLTDQSMDDLLWIREPFLTYRGSLGKTIIHGHTPEPDVHINSVRIGVDTGAFATGRLSAVRITPTQLPSVLQVQYGN